MRHRIFAVIAALMFTTGGLTGSWTGEITDTEGNRSSAYLQLLQDDGKITGVTGPGKEHSWPIQHAIYTGNHLTFTATSTDSESGEQSKWFFDLTVNGDRMEGTGEGSRAGQSWKVNITLTRQK
ncbi:MAG TPA: hypothetical protein VIB39_18340 [Candidatus Angelobacter sp.]